MAIDPDSEPLFDALGQRIDITNARIDEQARLVQQLGAADNALNSADKALERQLADALARIAKLEANVTPARFGYFTDADIARIRANGVTPAVTRLLQSAEGRTVLSFVPAPVVEVRRPGNQAAWVTANPSVGAPAGNPAEDSKRAYVAALLWLATGDTRYAVKGQEIVRAWGICERVLYDQPRRPDTKAEVWQEGKLCAAWSAPLFDRAADLLSRTGYPTEFRSQPWVDVMSAPVYGWTGGANWILSQASALMEMHAGVDPVAYARARSYLCDQVKASIALGNSASNLPPAQSSRYPTASSIAAAWGNPTSWPDGLCQESDYDMGHAMLGIGAAVNGALVARNMGEPLPADIEARIVASLELHARWLLQARTVMSGGTTPAGWNPTGWPLPTTFQLGGDGGFRGWAVAVRLFGPDRVPVSAQLAAAVAPEGYAMHSSYGTLTHT